MDDNDIKCLVEMNTHIRNSIYEPKDKTWDYECIKDKFFCPICREVLHKDDIFTTDTVKTGVRC